MSSNTENKSPRDDIKELKYIFLLGAPTSFHFSEYLKSQFSKIFGVTYFRSQLEKAYFRHYKLLVKFSTENLSPKIFVINVGIFFCLFVSYVVVTAEGELIQ